MAEPIGTALVRAYLATTVADEARPLLVVADADPLMVEAAAALREVDGG